jgi:hypothetical protein
MTYSPAPPARGGFQHEYLGSKPFVRLSIFGDLAVTESVKLDCSIREMSPSAGAITQ